MILLRRDKNGKAEVFDVPESVVTESELQKHKVEATTKDCHSEAIDVYKMEYEKAAQRYNDLYNAAWTNFSYMLLVAGGLLTFAGARFVTPLTILLACLPLLFWWIATFEPLNRYGDKVQKEMGDIEKALNALCMSADFPEDARKGLSHFQNFAKRGQKEQWSLERVWRVRYIVRITGLVFLLITIYFGIRVGSIWMKDESLTVKPEPLAVLVTTPSPTPSAAPTALPTASPISKPGRSGT